MRNSKVSSSKRQAARILIVDDHPIIRDSFAALIAGHDDLMICAEAEDIASAMQSVELHRPDIAVIDIALKQENGLELIRKIHAKYQSVRILVVSMHDENLYGERVLAAGGMGYLSKEAASRRIVDAIHRILEGKIYLSEELSERLLNRRLTRGKSSLSTGVTSLTDRELEVFTLIGNGRTTHDIATILHLSIKTVETHRQKIKWKLQLKNAAELSREAARWVVLNR